MTFITDESLVRQHGLPVAAWRLLGAVLVQLQGGKAAILELLGLVKVLVQDVLQLRALGTIFGQALSAAGLLHSGQMPKVASGVNE